MRQNYKAISAMEVYCQPRILKKFADNLHLIISKNTREKFRKNFPL